MFLIGLFFESTDMRDFVKSTFTRSSENTYPEKKNKSRDKKKNVRRSVSRHSRTFRNTSGLPFRIRGNPHNRCPFSRLGYDVFQYRSSFQESSLSFKGYPTSSDGQSRFFFFCLSSPSLKKKINSLRKWHSPRSFKLI